MTTNATERDLPAAVISWPAVPVEIIRAAGLRPIFARGGAMATPAADAHLEPEIFPSRLRRLVDEALTGQLSGAACVIVPRTSDPDYKTFLYLREFVRRGIIPTLPPTMLFDLLQSDGPDVSAYDAARTRVLLNELASVTGRHPSLEDVRHEIERTNGARAAARRLVALRQERPRVNGSEVFPLLGAFWQVDPDEYMVLASEAAAEIAQRPPLNGPRVLLAGAPMDSPFLHEAIESHGAIVVAEAGPWGSGCAGNDVERDGDPLTALADKYRRDAIGPRTPVGATRRLLWGQLENIDAVIVSLPAEDTAFGWDYPSMRDLLQARDIPHLCLRGDPYRPLPAADHDALHKLVGATATTAKVRHG